MKNTTHPKNQSRLKEKGTLFSGLTFGITSFIRQGLPEEKVKEHVKREYSKKGKPKVAQDTIDRLVKRYQRLHEQSEADWEWEDHWEEFRDYLIKIGIKLRDFDNAVRKSTYPSSDRRDFFRFLVAYYLIATDKASIYVVDNAYQTIANNTFGLFTHELYRMSDDLSHVLNCIAMGFSDILDGNNEPLAPNVSVGRSGFLHFLKFNSKTVMTKTIAVLATPYAPYTNCEPEEWIGYLFYFKGTEIFPILRRILSVLLDEVMGTEQLENKPLV